MKRLRNILMALVGISLIMSASCGLSYAQPNIPREKIPSNINSDVREQFEKLYSSDPVERALGASNLGKAGKEAVSAIPFLIGILGDDTKFIWLPYGNRFAEQTSPGREAAKTLAKIGEPALQSLIDALKDKYSSARKNAAVALGKIKNPRIIEPLIAALKDKDSDVRSNAVEILRETGKMALQLLIAALKDEDSYIRGNAALVLGKIKDPRVVEPLITSLEDDDSNVRGNAAWALGEIKDVRAVEPLIAALKDEGLAIRINVTKALGEIKDPRAVEPLIITLRNDYYSVVRISAAETLGKIKDPRVVEPLIATLKDENQKVKVMALLVLKKIGEPAVLPLITALKGEDLDVRWRAAEALGDIKDPRAVEPLVDALKDENSGIREEASVALWKINDIRAVEPLIAALKNENSGVSETVAWVLKVLTGVNFGVDHGKWHEWWEKDKKRTTRIER
ncbi:MAG: HEAT repeat domain-containing protein [Candidatus Brocadiales bacterium]